MSEREHDNVRRRIEIDLGCRATRSDDGLPKKTCGRGTGDPGAPQGLHDGQVGGLLTGGTVGDRRPGELL